jgi:hypothetical protein
MKKNNNDHWGIEVENALRRKGYGNVQIAAVIGNLQAESGGDHTVEGDNGTSYGIAQWHNDRKDLLFEHTKTTSPSLEQQVDFLIRELDGEFPGYGWTGKYKDVFANAKTKAAATDALVFGFFRPKQTAATMLSRRENADAYHADMVKRGTATPLSVEDMLNPSASKFSAQPNYSRATYFNTTGDEDENNYEDDLFGVPTVSVSTDDEDGESPDVTALLERVAELERTVEKQAKQPVYDREAAEKQVALEAQAEEERQLMEQLRSEELQRQKEQQFMFGLLQNLNRPIQRQQREVKQLPYNNINF